MGAQIAYFSLVLIAGRLRRQRKNPVPRQAGSRHLVSQVRYSAQTKPKTGSTLAQ
jgi:hypothetical protein